MKIAITSHGEDCHANIDARFGRADYFMLYDQENDSWSCQDNTQNLEAAHGAGIQAGQTLIKSGADVLITGHVGPKALKVLNTGKITIYTVGDDIGTVADALAAFQAGKLTAIVAPTGLNGKK